MATAIAVKLNAELPSYQIIMGEIFSFVREDREPELNDYYMKVSNNQVVQLTTGIILPLCETKSIVRLYDAEITLYPKRLGMGDFHRIEIGK